eukprot:scaffold126202_cov63-Phaeocystis_antarctica.AAC.1
MLPSGAMGQSAAARCAPLAGLSPRGSTIARPEATPSESAESAENGRVRSEPSSVLAVPVVAVPPACSLRARWSPRCSER